MELPVFMSFFLKGMINTVQQWEDFIVVQSVIEPLIHGVM